MKTALIEEIEVKRKHLMDVYEHNDQMAVSDEVIEASQELDKLIIEYLIMRETEKH